MQDLTGKLLIAMPGIGDPRFNRSVILVCAHSEDYKMGLVLNNPIDDLTLPELFTQLGIEQNIQLPDTYVLNGGPVGTDRGFVVHSTDYFSDGATVEVDEDFSMTATRDVLRAMADDYGALVMLGSKGANRQRHVIGIQLIDDSFNKARDFDLVAREMGTREA